MNEKKICIFSGTCAHAGYSSRAPRSLRLMGLPLVTSLNVIKPRKGDSLGATARFSSTVHECDGKRGKFCYLILKVSLTRKLVNRIGILPWWVDEVCYSSFLFA